MVVSIVATFKIWEKNLKIRISTFNGNETKLENFKILFFFNSKRITALNVFKIMDSTYENTFVLFKVAVWLKSSNVNTFYSKVHSLEFVCISLSNKTSTCIKDTF